MEKSQKQQIIDLLLKEFDLEQRTSDDLFIEYAKACDRKDLETEKEKFSDYSIHCHKAIFVLRLIDKINEEIK